MSSGNRETPSFIALQERLNSALLLLQSLFDRVEKFIQLGCSRLELRALETKQNGLLLAVVRLRSVHRFDLRKFGNWFRGTGHDVRRSWRWRFRFVSRLKPKCWSNSKQNKNEPTGKQECDGNADRQNLRQEEFGAGSRSVAAR